MPAPNLFIVYVTDVKAASVFYAELFGMTPVIASPRFAEFPVAEGVGLALWSGASRSLEDATARTGEVCLNLPGGPEAIRAEHRRWVSLGVEIVTEPHEEVFGLTFVAQDLDGNLLRVAPVDPD